MNDISLTIYCMKMSSDLEAELIYTGPDDERDIIISYKK